MEDLRYNNKNYQVIKGQAYEMTDKGLLNVVPEKDGLLELLLQREGYIRPDFSNNKTYRKQVKYGVIEK